MFKNQYVKSIWNHISFKNLQYKKQNYAAMTGLAIDSWKAFSTSEPIWFFVSFSKYYFFSLTEGRKKKIFQAFPSTFWPEMFEIVSKAGKFENCS